MDPTLNDPTLSPSTPGPLAAGMQTSPDATAGLASDGKIMERKTPEVGPSREALVKAWSANVKAAKEYWKKDFDRMRADQAFAAGQQWPGDTVRENYVANVTLRHIEQRVADLYAKNPKAVARRRERLLSTVWDGSPQSLQAAMAAMEQASQLGQPQVDPATGAVIPAMPPTPEQAAMAQQAMMQAQAVLQDAAAVHDQIQQLNRIAKTLELLYQYNIDEQIHPFKTMMKLMVRRAVTTGVGYVKLGFQRLMEKRPEIEAQINDISNQLATIEQISADIADGEIQPDGAENERLRLLMADLQKQEFAVTREGLIFDFPTSTSIIPDPKCMHLREFLGADWVAQEYMLSVDEIKQIYKVDVGKGGYNAYRRGDMGQSVETLAMRFMDNSFKEGDKPNQDVACVWEIYSKSDGMVYVVCDGYKEFLREPAAPTIYMERFFPWFVYVCNETDNEKTIYPPSDVSLIRDPQMEINRSRQGLREHRIANRPLTAAAQGVMDQEDLDKLQNRPANAVVELNALQPGQKVEDVLQVVKGPGIDPNMYETEGAFTDIMRTVGSQEANLGGTSNATATEASIAQASQTSAVGSNIDDMNDLLTQIARAAGQVLLLNVSAQTVKTIVGPGAVWPEMSAQEVAAEVFLEVEANSMGRPNQAQEIQNMERMAPLLMQIPGINPEFMAREMLRRLDDKMDLTEAFAAGLPSITAMNAMKNMSPAGGGPTGEAMSQGGQGAQNAQKPPPGDSQAPSPGGPPAPSPMLQ
jgi:hypothetical protein